MNILLMDSSDIVLQKMQELLSEFGCIQKIYTANNLSNLFSTIHLKQPDIIVIDISMPDKIGVEILQKIKLNLPKVKLIVVTNFATEQRKLICMQNGVDYYFDKATEFEKVALAIESECANRSV
ncbi:MAG: response regulator transcription factor [Bacteroidetes bacterium]|nr:response regulator transcription factor [Bacteroidota bacterium]MBS1591063.1 response regulator transcription factor [Bacteroidota bacterium]